MVKAKKKKYMGGGKMKYADGGKMKYKKGGKFPDLTGDGKVTMADILKGRGVGGKRTVAQGADKKDVRREKKMVRLMSRKKS